MENSKFKILAIDDNLDNLISLKALIKDAFSEVVVFMALTGQRGLELAESENPDVILLDIIMPGMDGFKVCKKLKANSELSEIPVVFVTAIKGDKESRIRALEYGAEAFLAKPIDESELTAQIRAMLKIRTANRQRRSENERLSALVAEKTKDLEIAFQQTLNLLEDLKKENQARKESEERFRLIFEQAPIGITVVESLTGKILQVNQTYAEITGRSIAEFSAMDWLSITHPEDVQEGLDQMALLNAGKTSGFTMMKRYLRPDGSIVWINLKVVSIQDSNLRRSHLCMIEDITERIKADQELRHISYHDQLTGLYNRRFFEEEFEKLDTQRNLPLSIIMCDINGLKLINDSFGHASGDELLKKTAEVIVKGCRAGDLIARLGGDEFVISLPATDAFETQQIINRIRDLASQVKVANSELSISLGYGVKENQEQTISETLENAENDMYRHKLFERSSMRSKTIDIIMNTLFEKSHRESHHSRRVSAICQAIADQMNLEKDDVGQIRIAGLVHDIGKIGVDEKILNKSGRLSDDEMNSIKKHPEIGWRILSSVNEFSELANSIIAHHEKWDGSGYPKGLKGKEIPLTARIITVADSYDAMTSERSYRKCLSKEETIAELKKCSGTQFDPEIIDLFVNQVLPYHESFGDDDP